ncbi:MAG: DUF1616 domain-containing protein, partial [Candidatus Bathyarchaeota archaeon]
QNLEKRGQISLGSQKITYNTNSSFFTYVKSFNSLWYWTVIFISLFSLFTIFLIKENIYPLIYLRNICASILLLFLPGFSLVKVLFSKKDLDVLEQIALSVGISLALVAIVGVTLNYTPFGIRTFPLAIIICAIVVVFSSIAVILENQKR